MQDWKGRTVLDQGQHYSVYGSGTYGYHGMNPSSTLHGGSHGYEKSKPSALKEKHQAVVFKAQTVQAGMDRDYHEMMMQRGHTPGDRSAAEVMQQLLPSRSQMCRLSSSLLATPINLRHKLHGSVTDGSRATSCM